MPFLLCGRRLYTAVSRRRLYPTGPTVCICGPCATVCMHRLYRTVFLCGPRATVCMRRLYRTFCRRRLCATVCMRGLYPVTVMSCHDRGGLLRGRS